MVLSAGLAKLGDLILSKGIPLVSADRNASQLARSNGPLPSVFALSMMPNESDYGDRGYQLSN